jgi:hypothetical protein
MSRSITPDECPLCGGGLDPSAGLPAHFRHDDCPAVDDRDTDRPDRPAPADDGLHG